jgi:hypothetical protein
MGDLWISSRSSSVPPVYGAVHLPSRVTEKVSRLLQTFRNFLCTLLNMVVNNGYEPLRHVKSLCKINSPRISSSFQPQQINIWNTGSLRSWKLSDIVTMGTHSFTCPHMTWKGNTIYQEHRYWNLFYVTAFQKLRNASFTHWRKIWRTFELI